MLLAVPEVLPSFFLRKEQNVKVKSNIIEQDELDIMLKTLVETVRMTKMPCFIIGDLEYSMIYSIVFGTTEAASGAVDSLGIPGAAILKVLMFENAVDDDEDEEIPEGTTIH